LTASSLEARAPRPGPTAFQELQLEVQYMLGLKGKPEAGPLVIAAARKAATRKRRHFFL
jgi:hypothetical protein